MTDQASLILSARSLVAVHEATFLCPLAFCAAIGKAHSRLPDGWRHLCATARALTRTPGLAKGAGGGPIRGYAHQREGI